MSSLHENCFLHLRTYFLARYFPLLDIPRLRVTLFPRFLYTHYWKFEDRASPFITVFCKDKKAKKTS